MCLNHKGLAQDHTDQLVSQPSCEYKANWHIFVPIF